MLSLNDPVYMHIPSWYREWFLNRNPSVPLLHAEPLAVQLFNIFQGGLDASMLWNAHFDRVLSLFDIRRSLKDLAVYFRVIDNYFFLLLVSTDDCIISTKSEKSRVKVVDHLKNYSPLTTKEGYTLDYLNCRIT